MSKAVIVSASHRWRVTYRKTQMRVWKAVRIHTDSMADKSDVRSYEASTALQLLQYIAPFASDDVVGRVLAIAGEAR